MASWAHNNGTARCVVGRRKLMQGLKALLRESYLRAVMPGTFEREDGQTMAEYAVVLGVIVVATIAIFVALGTGIAGKIGSVVTDLGG